MDDAAMKIITALGVSITPAQESIKILKAELASLSEVAKNTKLIIPGATSASSQSMTPMTAQAAMINQITEEGETKRVAIITKGEAEVSAIQAKEALTRQAIIEKEANAALAVQKTSYMSARQMAFEEKPTGFLSLLERHATWLAAGAAIYGSFELIKTSVLDVSASMTKLQQVLEIVPPYDKSPAKLTADLNELKDVAGVMATAYGVSFSSVLDVMAQAGRRFKDVASIISATDTALQLVVVDAVPVETAIKSVEAIMSQFGLTTGESKQALFEISAAAHMLQINATDLLTAIQRSGSAFSTMKMNSKEAVAAISTLAQMTAQGGSTIGNTWKSLEASLASDKGQKALKSLKIEIFDGNGKIKDMSTTLIELQDKWKTLSDQAKMHYAIALAGGKFQYQKLEAFLDDYTGAYKKALAGIETANVDMQKKLVEAAMTSLPQQLKMTSASLQVLTSELTTDATPALIMFLTSVRGGIVDLKDHDDELKKVLATGVKLAEGYVAWKIAVWAYTAATTNATIQTMGLQGGLLKLELTAKGVPGTMAAVAGSIGGVASVAIAAASKILLLVAALGVISRGVGMAMDPAGQKIKDLQTDISNLDSLAGKYNPLGNLKSAGSDLWSGHPGDAVDQLGQAVWGWLPGGNGTKAMYQEQRSKLQAQLDEAVAAKKTDTEAALTRDLDNLDAIMAKYEAEANAKTSDLLAGLKTDGTDNSGVGGDSAAKSKWLDKFLSDVLATALAQDKLNAANERGINAMEALKNLHTSNAMSAKEYAQGLSRETAMSELYRKQQEGLHAEADAYRVAITILEAKQKSINTSIDAGREAYDKIGTEIETARQKVDELGTSYVGLEGKIRAIPTDQAKETIQWVDKLKDMNAITIEQQIKLYEEVLKGNLEYAYRNELMQKTIDLGKEELQQAVDKKVADIEKQTTDYKTASDARIANIQSEIDVIDEKNAALERQKSISDDLLAISNAQLDVDNAQQDLTDTQTKLSNLQNEKNKRVFENGTWTYKSDSSSVADAQTAVDDAQTALETANTALVTAQTNYNTLIESLYKADLEAKIQVEKDKQTAEEKAGKNTIKTLNETFTDAKAKLDARGKELDTTLNSLLAQLGITADNQLKAMALTVATYSAQMKASLLSISKATGIDVTSITGTSASELVGSYDSGGTIPKTGLALVHKGEYMLNKQDVSALGGVSGIERLTAEYNSPLLSSISNMSRTTNNNTRTSTTTTKVDQSVNLNGPINFPHVIDGSTLIRNLKQYSKK